MPANIPNMFDDPSSKRIARAVNKVEDIPLESDNGGILPAHLVPYQIWRFKLKTTFSGYMGQQIALAERMYWDGTEWQTDTSTTYTLWSDLYESWDLLLNNDGSGAERKQVLAYHRHDKDHWQIIEQGQNLTRWVKLQEDWQVPIGAAYPQATYPHVSVKIYDPETSTELSDAFDAVIPQLWQSSKPGVIRYYHSPAPLLFDGDIAQVTVGVQGTPTITSSFGTSYLDQCILWRGSNAATVPEGYVVPDGSALPADRKVDWTNAPEYRGHMPMVVDPADAAGDASESIVGGTGGYRKHGPTENNHIDHESHHHQLTNVSTDIPNDGSTYSANTGTQLPELPFGTQDGIKKHTETDNRPQFFTTNLLYRYK